MSLSLLDLPDDILRIIVLHASRSFDDVNATARRATRRITAASRAHAHAHVVGLQALRLTCRKLGQLTRDIDDKVWDLAYASPSVLNEYLEHGAHLASAHIVNISWTNLGSHDVPKAVPPAAKLAPRRLLKNRFVKQKQAKPLNNDDYDLVVASAIALFTGAKDCRVHFSVPQDSYEDDEDANDTPSPLQLARCHPYLTQSIYKTIALLPNLTNLKFVGMRTDVDHEIMVSSLARCPDLKCLTIEYRLDFYLSCMEAREQQAASSEDSVDLKSFWETLLALKEIRNFKLAFLPTKAIDATDYLQQNDGSAAILFPLLEELDIDFTTLPSGVEASLVRAKPHLRKLAFSYATTPALQTMLQNASFNGDAAIEFPSLKHVTISGATPDIVSAINVIAQTAAPINILTASIIDIDDFLAVVRNDNMACLRLLPQLTRLRIRERHEENYDAQSMAQRVEQNSAIFQKAGYELVTL